MILARQMYPRKADKFLKAFEKATKCCYGYLLVDLKPFTDESRGWSGGAMVLGKFPVPGRPTVWIAVGQGPTALAVGAGGGCLEFFTLVYPFLSSFSLSLGECPI